MTGPGPRTAAGIGVVLATATGYITNLLSSSFSVSLLAALLVLVAAGIYLAVRTTNDHAGRRTTVRQRAHGATIHNSPIRAAGTADVSDTSGSGARTADSPISAENADVDRRNDGGSITGSSITGT